MAYKGSEKQKAYRKKWHEEHYGGEHAAEHRAAVAARRAALRQFINDYKAAHPCTRCGESEPACLDFHHEGDKERNLSAAAVNGWSIERTLREIEKCVVLCANCHRKHHAGLV